MKLIIISGLSGSGKSAGLRTLEDEGYYCVDNLPLELLADFVIRTLNLGNRIYENVAVGIDARSGSQDLNRFREVVTQIRNTGVKIETVFLQAELNTLFKRFSETRRKHPLTSGGLSLREAIEAEYRLLGPIAHEADLILDTTHTNIHQFRALFRERVLSRTNKSGLSLLFQSFGFKHGSPSDSDFVFDVRCLPNPHWQPDLKPLTGRDEEVINFLEQHNEVEEMFQDICQFLTRWIPRFEAQDRFYLTVSIGCTGGQHRSVFMAEKLCNHFRRLQTNVSLRHRELQ